MNTLSPTARVRLPLALTLLRACLAPVMILLAIGYPTPIAFGVCLTIAFASDVFDGIIARWLGVATSDLRRMDSIVDTFFYLCTAFAAWHLYPFMLNRHIVALLVLGSLEATRYVFDLWKFGREASYHMWSAKLWGIVLFITFFGLLAFHYTGAGIAMAIYLGIVVDIEGLIISMVLPRWKSDVPTLLHAYRYGRPQEES